MIKERIINGVAVADPSYKVTKSELIGGSYKITWQCPIYATWKSMIDRCYNEKCINKRPTYRTKNVCESWLRFSNFERWFRPKYRQGFELDKDLKMLGSNIYSPETCLVVHPSVNCFLVGFSLPRGRLPKGVRIGSRRKKYEAQVNNGERSVCLGSFDTAQAAHRAWQEAKAARAKELAALQEDQEVSDALVRLADKLIYEANNGIETKCEGE